MKRGHVISVSYAIKNGNKGFGPVSSGFMLEGGSHLAGRLLENNFTAEVYDFNNFESVRKISKLGKEKFIEDTINTLHNKVRKTKTKLLAFTTYNNGFRDLIEIIGGIKKKTEKENYQLKIVAGGPLVSWFESKIFDTTNVFDIIVPGLGDNAIIRLAEYAYENLPITEIPNAIYLDNGKIRRNEMGHEVNITKLPFPIYDSHNPSINKGKFKISTLRTSVSCAQKCHWCVHSGIGGRYRQRNPEDAAEEVKFLLKEYGIKYFRLSDSNPSAGHLNRIMERLPENVKISCFAHAGSKINWDLAEKYISCFFVGVESTGPKTLLQLGKTKNPEKYIEHAISTIEKAKEHGIPTVWANIVPIANDTINRIKKDLEKIIEIGPDFITAVPLIAIPGTEWYKKIIQEGDQTGCKLMPDYIDWLMCDGELDLLSKKGVKTPALLKVDGNFVDPTPISKWFIEELSKQGIDPASDEIVTMAYAYYNGLNKNQTERRKQVNIFHSNLRKAIIKGDYKTLKKISKKINY